ncbi:hypothetical protein ES332_A01G177100v1 [Gossypium tomentosum]|uniref:Rhodanese domain-containing protein n=1 Tax=Gossypium tomentosum TaxID=34277 RepID=A0A5D2RUE0_GOSTO|nr:hypothetical protein ES332_A01G177100v1 [Gossypium tomentosum]
MFNQIPPKYCSTFLISNKFSFSFPVFASIKYLIALVQTTEVLAMASLNPSGYEKFSGSPPKQRQEAATTGIPLSSSNQYSTESCETNARLQTKTRVPWSSGLCDCFSDWRNCCITCWCPCVTFGQIAEIVDKESSSCGVNGALYTLIACVTGCACCYSCFYRSKMRQQYMLKKHPCGDCLVHCCCEYCALCQEYRELKTRGYDLSDGMEIWKSGVPPVVEEGMSR